jgi:cell division protease FtsH
MFVGVGAARVRDLFSKAKKAAPCIIFIDEIDAVGRMRGAGMGGGNDEREQTLNQILVEMDGFESNSGVIVIAATNRPDVLDPALLRPGRFDRRITLELPGLNDREAILKTHAKSKPLEDDVNLRRIAERTIGFSGADLMNIMNEGAILSARLGLKKVSQKALLEAIEKVMLGPERRSAVFTKDEKKLTAYHEAGHAIVGHVLAHTDEVHKISIISRGRAAGYTMSLPSEDKHMHFRQKFIDDMAMMLGGYAAEKTFFGDITTGASNDLEKATSVAKQIVMRYGMTEELGPRTYGEREEMLFMGKDNRENRDYSEKTAQEIDEAVLRLLEDALKTAKKTIADHRESLEKVVAVLLDKETIEKEEFEKIVGKPKKLPRLQVIPAQAN